MAIQYLVTFCRISIGLVFTWSFFGKVKDFSSFYQTINRLKLLPEALHRPIAVILLGGELMVLGAMILGGEFLKWGFLLAVLLLILFSVVLTLALVRQIQTSCNCFGLSKSSISSFDIVRNIILILLSFGGFSSLLTNVGKINMLDWLDWILVGIISVVFVAILVQLREIVQVFR